MSLPPNEITFVIGAPGSGKGTLCKELSQHHDYYHLSVGDYLRSLVAGEESQLNGLTRSRLQKYLKSRELLPPEEIVAMLQRKIQHDCSQGQKKVLIDGFPRDLNSAKLWDETVRVPDEVLYFDCHKEEAMKRFLFRSRDPGDGDAVFEKRYGEFERNNREIITHYGDIVKTVDTSGGTEVSRKNLLAVLDLQ
ncbi:hypothetical protein DOTSEDRAFT_126084 [Dothistroma septosporum NZE10]|uniref:P-loop containing nucleoside triphosphate hydrolase protein n=1 Tax=Dothistroma septosporum (strain NZE10 / CBS 128990) TaxID=675120 RepID=N1PRK7_DOTSN|nr:hypothetical protein DOTSEDRAFT_126084 [Dothistroma septosporum NZE10]